MIKLTTLIIALLFYSVANAQTPKPNTLFKNGVKSFKGDSTVGIFNNSINPLTSDLALHGSLASTFHTAKMDTIQCYFHEITGVVNGELIGKWNDGFMVIPHRANHGNYWVISEDEYKPIYLYHNKKQVTNKVIQYY